MVNATMTIPILKEEIAKQIVQCAVAQMDVLQAQLQNKNIGNYNTGNLIQVSHAELVLGNLIDEGSFAAVYDIRSCQIKGIQPQQSVVKILKPSLLYKTKLFKTCCIDIAKESAILSRLSHPNIIQLQAVSRLGIEAYVNGRNDAYFLVLERIENTLADKLDFWRHQTILAATQDAATSMPFAKRFDIAVQIANALQYLHKHCILHRDIKPENIGIDRNGNVKILDFDMATILEDNQHTSHFKLTNKVGTYRYMSREVALGYEYNISADVYSFGLVLYALLSMQRPFNHLSDPRDFRKLVYLGNERPNCDGMIFSKVIFDLLSKCWSNDFMIRPTAYNICTILQTEKKKLQSKDELCCMNKKFEDQIQSELMEKEDKENGLWHDDDDVVVAAAKSNICSSLTQFMICWGNKNSFTKFSRKRQDQQRFKEDTTASSTYVGEFLAAGQH